MQTEYQAIVCAVDASKKKYPDEVVIVFRTTNGEYGVCTESSFLGDDNDIMQRYLNGTIVPA